MASPSNFSAAGAGPNYGQYIQLGQQAVLQPLSIYDDAMQATRERLYRDEQMRLRREQEDNERLLAPVRLEQAKVSLRAGQLNNEQAERDLKPLDYLGSGSALGPIGGDGGALTATATGYHPVAEGDPEYKMEGGHLDALGKPINTLDAFRRGEASYVTAAIDRQSPLFGQTVFSPTLNAPLRFSDTGGAFRGKGNSRIDVARDTAAGANSDENNGPVTLSLGGTASAKPLLPGVPLSAPGFAPIGQIPSITGTSLRGPGPNTYDTVKAVSPDGREVQVLPDYARANGYRIVGAVAAADRASGAAPAASAALRAKAGPVPMQTGPGYIDPITRQPVFSTDRRVAASLGTPYGMVSKPVYSPTVAKQDARDLTMAEKLGLDPTVYEQNADDPNGSLAPEGRANLKRDIARTNAELAKSKISEGADGQLHLSDDAIEDYAQRSLLDPSVRFAGLGKVAAGANIEIANRRAEIQRATGMTGTDAYVAQQGVGASRLALRDQEKKRANIVGFEQTARENAKIALDLLDKGAGGSAGIPVFNRWIQAGRKATGDPEVAAFNTAIGAFTNEYAKIISGNTGAGGATDSSRREAAELINKGGTVEQLRAQLDVAFREMENRTSAIDGQIERLTNSIRNASKSKSAAPAPREDADDTGLKQPTADVLAKARAAIAKGASRESVAERLRSGGFDPSGL